MATADLSRRVREHSWYHTIELAPGLVTEGWFDLRPYRRALRAARADGRDARARRRHLGRLLGVRDGAARAPRSSPSTSTTSASSTGRRAGGPETFRRAARGDGFRLAHEILGSKVERVTCSIYDATPEELGHVRPRLLRHGPDPPARPAARARADRRALPRARSSPPRSTTALSAADPVPGLPLPRRPRRRGGLLAAERADLAADDVDRRLRRGRASAAASRCARATASRSRTSSITL